MKNVYVATHGAKEFGTNPGMTEKGFTEVRSLKNLIPEQPSCVVVGTGKRNLDVAQALGLTPTRYSTVVGNADGQDMVEGKPTIILADGTYVDPVVYSSLDDMSDSAKKLVASLPDNAVICAGRPMMIMLDTPKAKSGALYCVSVEDDKIVNITEVVALGVVDPVLTK